MTLLPSSSAKSRPRRLHHRHSSFKSTIPPLNSFNSYISYAAKKLAKIILHSSIATVTVLTLQLLYVIYRTPRLPPPPLSGVDFPREGRRIAASPPDQMIADEDLIKSETSSSTTTTPSTPSTLSTITKRKEFRLVLIGDSPVEGVGNTTHNVALSGQTAKAFAQKVLLGGGGGMQQQQQQKQASDRYDYDCVRYWSYGKSGLTARGIEEEMITYLHRVVEDIISTDDTSSEEVHQKSSTIHAIVLLCGVNNVLDVNSTASSFYLDVKSLIRSIRNNPRLMNTPLIVLGLPDFSTLPFLPWPLAFALGIRGRMMQRMLEKAIREIQLDEQERDSTTEKKGIATTTLKVIPDVQTLGSIGYHCYRSCEESDKSATIQMRFCHQLLKYLGGVKLTQDRIASLGMIDFLCDDGFHPGKLGTVYVGNLIREAYEEIMT